jgi:DNA-binding NarL/FixJ family response regulator
MTKANASNPFGLTYRQCEVMESLVRHGDSKLVARELCIDHKTVDWHIKAAVKTMRCRNRIAACVKWDRRVREEAEYHGARAARSVFDMGSVAIRA